MCSRQTRLGSGTCFISLTCLPPNSLANMLRLTAAGAARIISLLSLLQVGFCGGISMKTLLGSFCTFGALAIVLYLFPSVSQLAGQGTKGGASSAVDRGKYLVNISGCHDCHSPKKDAQGHVDETRPLSGRPTRTPVPSRAPNE